MQSLKVGIYGCGYVGLIFGIFLAKKYNVTFYDINKNKINQFIDGDFNSIKEAKLDDNIKKNKKNIMFSNEKEKLLECNLIFICVGTPNGSNGNLDISQVEDSLLNISRLDFGHECEVFIRSTMPVSSSEMLFTKYNNKKITYGLNPEFLREGNAFDDLENQNLIVIGSQNKNFVYINEIYKNFSNIHHVDLKTAELIKSMNNSWHAVKVVFANEIGRICDEVGANKNELVNVFLSDEKLNVSKAYMKPGLPFGGSCLVKDTKGLATKFDSTFFRNVIQTNDIHIDNIVKKLLVFNKIGINGLSFKKGTNDLRFSVGLLVANKLIELGKDVLVFDPLVDYDKDFKFKLVSEDQLKSCDYTLNFHY